MMKNIALKKNNLNINTTLESQLFESKTPKSQQLITNLRKSQQVNGNSPKNKNNYTSNPANHVHSFSGVNNGTNGSNGSNKQNYLEEKYQGSQGNNRSNSKSGLRSNNGAYDAGKREIDLESKFYPTTFSPKSTKNNTNSIQNRSNLNSGNSINLTAPNNSKLQPLSTRNGPLVSSSIQKGGKESSQPELVNVMSLLGSQNTQPLSIKNLYANINEYEPSKYSAKSLSVVKSYAANTHQGIIR
jgi:hypothetical protein